MIFFDNIIFELQRAGGISVYWSELIHRINKSDVVFFGRNNDNIFTSKLCVTLYDEKYPSFVPRRYLPFWPRFYLGSIGKHIFHSSYMRYSSNPKALNVITIHDFTYEHYIEGIRKWVHCCQKGNAVKRSSGIICVSQNTKKDLLDFYPWVREDCVKVIYNGVGNEFFPVKHPTISLKKTLDYEPGKPYFLFVGDRSSYKNFDIVVDLADQFPDFELVVVGGKPFSDEERRKLSSISSRIKHFRGVPSETLNLLYNAAFCLVYPSSYEGFGIPLLEAMKAGCPVVSTNLSSIPEVAGDAALLVDEVKVECFAEKIRKLSDESFRNRLIEKGFAQASQFSWDKCFEETYAFYQELWKRSKLK